MINKETVDQIISTARVEEVINDFVTLKKRGVNYIGHCPFHDEKTPSFTVSPAKGIYKCFGCGKAGNAVNFVMEHEHYTYPEALKYIAKKYGIQVEETAEELSPEEDFAAKEKESLFIVTAFANSFFKKCLHETEEGKAIALSYFQERGFTKETINKFELGYSPDAWDAFTQAAISNGYKIEFLEKTGLTVVNENKKYDRFRARVIFPIHNLSNKVIGFGGRILKTDAAWNVKSPKYVNSPESEIYHKSKVLYGLNHARKAITGEDNCFLVEGYTDVISMHQTGIENVVSSSGTSLTVEQIRLIKRYTSKITVIYDGDPAGIKASLRGIDLILEQGMNVKIVLLPDGEDPDSMAKNNSSKVFRDFIKDNSTDFVIFKTKLLLDEAKGDPLKKATLIREIVETIAKVEDSILANLFIKECSTLMDVNENILITEMNKIKRRISKRETNETAFDDLVIGSISQQPEYSDPDKITTTFEETELLRLLLNYGNLPWKDESGEPVNDLKVADIIIDELNNEGIKFSDANHAKLLDEIKFNYAENNFIDDKYFTSHVDENIRMLSIDLLTTKYSLSDNWNTLHHIVVPLESELIYRAVSDNLNRLKLKVVETRMHLLEGDLKSALSEDQLNSRLEEYQLLTNAKIELSKMLTRVIIK